jgi:redox-sensitive bicupin YhaK (pirin superfamily)
MMHATTNQPNKQETAMKMRSIQQQIRASAVSEGAGVTVHRTLGTPALKNLDPFLMLDHFGSDDPEQYIAGFPDHPHRGFVTLTYMLDGHMEHRDSMGNRGDLCAGGAQWMKAASGVIHSEMPRQNNGLMRGFQLWINLPAAEKMSAPAYQEFGPQAIPEVAGDGIRVRVLAGEYVANEHAANDYSGQDATTRGVIDDPHTDLRYLDVRLDPGSTFSLPLSAALHGFIYVFEGEARISAQTAAHNGPQLLPQHSLSVLSAGDAVELNAGAAGARFILVAGKPIGEAVVQYGPFVMNTRDEIEQAMRDYRDGNLVRAKAAMHAFD